MIHSPLCTCAYCAACRQNQEASKQNMAAYQNAAQYHLHVPSESRGTLSQVKARQIVQRIQSDEPINQSNAPTFQKAIEEIMGSEEDPGILGPVTHDFPTVQEAIELEVTNREAANEPIQVVAIDRKNGVVTYGRFGEPEDCDLCGHHQCQVLCKNSVMKWRPENE